MYTWLCECMSKHMYVHVLSLVSFLECIYACDGYLLIHIPSQCASVYTNGPFLGKKKKKKYYLKLSENIALTK